MFEIIRYLIYRKYFKKAFKFFDRNNYRAALNTLKFLKNEKKIDSFYIDLNIGKAYHGLKKYDEAKDYYLSSFKKFNVNPVPLIGIGLILMKKKRYIFAYKYLKKALNLDPIHPQANYYMGLCLIALDKKERSQKYFEKVLAEKKEFLFARMALYFEQDLSIESGLDLGEF